MGEGLSGSSYVSRKISGMAMYWERLSGDSYALGKDAIFANGKVITEYTI